MTNKKYGKAKKGRHSGVLFLLINVLFFSDPALFSEDA